MARLPNRTDFTVPVEGIGAFTFAKRSLRDELAIGSEYSRLTEGVDTPTPWLEAVAGWIAALKVLTVEAPKGWNIDELDPLDPETYAKLRKVHAALREKEGSFRRPGGAGGKADGQGVGSDDGVRVPAPVQPAAD
jgi:hypothetical protein